MADDDIRSTSTGEETHSVGARVSGGQAKAAGATLRASTTAGSGLGKLGAGQAGMPKQDPGESLSDYMERVRKYREANQGQKQALQAMGK